MVHLFTFRISAPRAKYGDESVYFDLKDIGNTTGAWDIYGSDGPSPYNGFQVRMVSLIFISCETISIPYSFFEFEVRLNAHYWYVMIVSSGEVL